MRLGQAAMEALRAEITGCLKPGDELVVACPVALKGTSVIAKNKKDKLAERFSAGFIQNCVSLWDAYGAGSIVWKIVQEADASALYAMGEGGFLSALWKMAEASEVGLEANSGNDRLLYSGGSARYLERPAEDELQQLLKE